MRTVSQRLDDTDRDAQKMFSGFAKLGGRLESLGASLSIGLTAPIAAAGFAATKFAADFELGIAKVASLMGSVTTKEMKGLSDGTLELSRRLGIDAVKATEALYEAISAGVPKETALEFLGVASKAAIAGVTDTKVAVDGLTSIINAYGLQTKDAREVSDAMFQSVNLGKFTFDQLAQSISIATPLAAQLGVSFKDLLAGAATLTGQGFSVSEAMTSIRASMVAIISPNKAMNELLERTGYQSGQAMIQANGLQGSLGLLRQAAGGNVQILSEAIGRVEGLGAVLGLTGDKSLKASQDLNALRNSTGAAEEAFKQIDKSTSRQFDRLTNELKGTAIELGTALLPAVNTLLKNSKPLLEMLQGAVTWFTQLPAPVQTTGLAIAATAAALGPLLFGAGQIVSTFASLGGAFVTVTSGASGLVGALTSLPGMISNIATAVQSNMIGALTTGETVLLRFGQAAALAAAAFAGWQLGKWAYEQIPAVKALGDSLSDFLVMLHGGEANMLRFMGITQGTKEAFAALDFATQKLEKALKEKGIIVDKTGLSTEQYAEKLRKAAKDAGLFQDSTEKARVSAAKYGPTLDQLGVAAEDVGKKHDKAKKSVKAFGDELLIEQIRQYTQEHRKLGQEIVKLDALILKEKVSGKSWHDEAVRGSAELARLGVATADLSKVKIPDLITSMNDIAGKTDTVTVAFQRLGIQSSTDLKRVAEESIKARDAVLGSNVTTDFEKKQAVVRALEAQIAAAKSAGEIIPREQSEMLDRMKKEIETKIPDIKRPWEDFGKEVSTVITNAAQSMAKALFDGDLSFGEKFKNMAKSLGEAVISHFIQPATAALTKFIEGVLTDLLSGKGLGGVLGHLKDIGSSIAGIFGGGGSAASAAGAAGGVFGGASAAGDAAGSVAGAAGQAVGMGVQGVMGIVTGAVSAVSGIISNFQMMGMNKSLDLIEHEVRYSQIHLNHILDQANKYWPWLENIAYFNYNVMAALLNEIASSFAGVDDRLIAIDNLIRSHALPVLEDIRDTIKAFTVAPQPNIVIQGNVIGQREYVTQLANEIAGRLRIQGATA